MRAAMCKSCATHDCSWYKSLTLHLWCWEHIKVGVRNIWANHGPHSKQWKVGVLWLRECWWLCQHLMSPCKLQEEGYVSIDNKVSLLGGGGGHFLSHRSVVATSSAIGRLIRSSTSCLMRRSPLEEHCDIPSAACVGILWPLCPSWCCYHQHQTCKWHANDLRLHWCTTFGGGGRWDMVVHRCCGKEDRLKLGTIRNMDSSLSEESGE